ncbi:hypothetical protein BOTBODRAFT_171420 [Botryobasidium botryosum FD-172 SS1]|uniref:Uncharacterized protein n=1 Tax=Botryobasidium botryosum (strain FD-172 SS1) TaxID=930990 RepID=A0A067N387_BOTB1|nr:hypothetical protein BOTBODRAFT_171420 [Botryobasidium botryosum FD-172 SS1]
MTEGQNMETTNPYRVQFYDRVLAHAKEIRESDSYTPNRLAVQNHQLVVAFSELESLIIDTFIDSSLTSGQKKSKRTAFFEEYKPFVIIAFDEASVLVGPDDNKPFKSLCRALRTLDSGSLFTLFLSTTGQISQISSPSEQPDPSSRLLKRALKPNPPFTFTDFDLFAKKEGGLTLTEVTRQGHMGHLGCALYVFSSLTWHCCNLNSPSGRWATRIDAAAKDKGMSDRHRQMIEDDMIAFAAAKLLNLPALPDLSDYTLTEAQIFACLAQRLPLEFDSTNSPSSDMEKDQVENHMRICLGVGSRPETLVTASASEPILSEAAYAIMQHAAFKPEYALYAILGGFPVHKGDHGEYLALLLFLQSRDAVVRSLNDDAMWEGMKLLRDGATGLPMEWKRAVPVVRWLGSLVRDLPQRLMEDIHRDFGMAELNFNHSIKAHEHKHVHRRDLVQLLSRSAGQLCVNSKEPIDAVLPILFDERLSESAIGPLFAQFNNVRDLALKWDLFDKMDPFELGVYDRDDEPYPLIRIVFAMANSPSMETRHTVLMSPNGHGYAAYDIWCSGLSPQFLAPISPEKEDVWQSLLGASYA